MDILKELEWCEQQIWILRQRLQQLQITAAASAGGSSDHSALSNLTYAAAGHTGFEPAKGADDNFVTDAQFTLISALDADLATFSVPASTTISTAGAALIDDANAAAQIATLGLDADIATLSLPASTTISTAGAALIDDANAAAQLTTLGAVPIAGGTMTGLLEARDHGTAATDEVINVCYGTGSAPTASTTTEGSIYLTYTA
jgi:hypothetical protein